MGGYRWVVVRWVGSVGGSGRWCVAVGGWRLAGGYAASIRHIKLLTKSIHAATHSNGYSIATSVRQLKRFKNKRMRLITVRIPPSSSSNHTHNKINVKLKLTCCDKGKRSSDWKGYSLSHCDQLKLD